MEFEGKTFEGETVSLDGNTYRDCTFNKVLFQYAGGPVEMSECALNNFSFQFGGDLAQGLFTLFQLFGTDGMLQIIRGFTDPQPGEVVLQV